MTRNPFNDPDRQFHFKHTVDWKGLVALHPPEVSEPLEETVGFYRDTLDLLGTVYKAKLAPVAQDNDRIGATFKDGDVVYAPGTKAVLEQLVELDALALSVPREHGGQGLPSLCGLVNLELMSEADPSFMTVYAWHSVIATTILHFADDDLIERYVPKLVSGELNGSMSITEAGAGSDLGAIRTRAVRDGDHYKITGEKIFITNGNGGASIVLARTSGEPGPDGLGGLSLFVVPRYRDDGTDNFTLGKLEKKLGIRASPTVPLHFNDSVGYLVGEEGKGFKQMLYLMNEARLGVSMQALGIAQAAFNAADEYASAREQFDKPIGEHPPTADKLLYMQTTIQAMRALAYKAAEFDAMKEALTHKLRDFDGSDEDRKTLEAQLADYKHRTRELTPLIKYFATEQCVRICEASVQIHGGTGYMAESVPSRLLRDSLITRIYEGTSQIQALMAMKDTLAKSGITPFVGKVRSFGNWIRGRFADDLGKGLLEAETLYKNAAGYLRGQHAIGMSPFGKTEDEAEDYSRLSAERLTRLKADYHIAQILVEQARQFPEREKVARRFLQTRLGEMREDSRVILSGNTSTLEYIKERAQAA